MNVSIGQNKTAKDFVSGIQSGNHGSLMGSQSGRRFVQVARRSGEKVPGVYMRGDVFYARVIDPVSGKRKWVRASTQSIDGAARLVRECKAAVGAERSAAVAAALSATRVRSEWPSVGALIDQYEAAADKQRMRGESPSLKTQVDAVARLRQIVTEQGLAVDSLSLGGLVDVAEAWAQERCRVGANRNSTGTTLRIARSVFARWARVEFSKRGFKVPVELADHWPTVEGSRPQYQLQSQELRERTIKAGFAEIEAGTNVGLAFALCFCAGMSRIDAVLAEWSWIRDNGQVVYARNKTGRRADPALPPEVFERLRVWPGREARVNVLPGDSVTARGDVIDEQLNPWMRALGWETRQVAHELRKLACSVWATNCNISWAARWIGDTEATAAAYYRELLPEAAPNPWG